MAIQRIEFGRPGEAAHAGCGCGGGACMCGGHGGAGTSRGGVELQVDGMTCEHCVRAVTEELSAIPDVSDVHVDLVPGGRSRVQVVAAGPLDRETVRAAIEDAGYRLATLPD
ncbi:heavy-metal-associated domain-containing protein [Microbacterium sp. GXF7504]